jgi:predicted negative regulator of RcsB-dependent stress response
LYEQSRSDEALTAYDKAVALAPNLAQAWLGRGNVFCEFKRFDEALAAYDRAATLNPDLANELVGRGNVFCELKRFDEALAAYDRAVALKPDMANGLVGRGNVFCQLKRFDEALAAYHQALTVKPDFAEAHFFEGLLRLRLGEMEVGWKKYEFRWGTKQQRAGKRNFSQPLWLGETDIENKTILLHAEQGLGDTLLALRYISMITALGAQVILEVQPALKSLLQGFDGVSALISRGEPIPDFDVHCPIMGLPLAFKTTMQTIPAKVPYITVPQNVVEKWRRKLSAEKFKVGFAWAGNPTFVTDRDRSILLKNILPITSIAGANYYSLQKDLRHGDDEILNSTPQIVRLDKHISDFQDTAAIMMSLDLVISSDTSVVNLAGALGRPAWVLLSFMSDWRWLLDRNDTPWYPTARLFRQVNIGDWTTVMDDVCTALKQLLER